MKTDGHPLFGMFSCVLLIGFIPTILVEALSKRKVEAPNLPDLVWQCAQ